MTDIQISGFEMLSKLGQGGMATVWKARQVSLDRIVAIKILSSRMASDPGDLQRFQQESQSAAKLKHPGIVQVYDANIENGLYFFVMEFVAGYTCADWQKRVGHLAEKDVLLIADCVADALDYAWAREKLVHCDIKPDNIMIDDDGTVKVTDLGLARTISTMTAETSEDILGTPSYMAPEQAMGMPGLDCRTDMYSLGAMLYHLATGKLLFEGCEVEEVMERQIKDFVPNPRDLNPSLSKGFCRLVEVLMAKEQAGRPLDWQQVRESIKYIRKGLMPRLKLPEGMASTVLPGAPQEHLVPPLSAGSSVAAHAVSANKKRSKAPVVIIALVLACATVAVLLMQWRGGTAPRHAASVPSSKAGGGPPGDLKVVSGSSGSLYAERAQRDSDRLIAVNREKAVVAQLAALKSEADRLISQRDYDSAIRSYQEYTGEFEPETRSVRVARVEDIKRAQAEWLEGERIRVEGERVLIEKETQARVETLLDAVARSCVDGDYDSATRSLGQALGDDMLSRRADALSGLFNMLKSAAQIDDEIMGSFARQQGQQITVDLVSGTKSLLIKDASGGVVSATVSTVSNGRSGTVIASANFTLKDLSVNERIKRMGPDSQPHVSLAKGVLAYKMDSFDHARRFFSATHELLAPRLLAFVDDRQLRLGGHLMINTLRGMMGRAGLTPGAEFDSFQWVDVLQASVLSPVQADTLRQAATLFRQENRSRPGYDQVDDVVAAMISVQAARPDVSRPPATPVVLPNIVLPDDIAGLVGNPDAVMDRLLEDNRSMGSGNVEMNRDDEGRVIGVRIRSNAIGDIRALAGLRDLRSVEIRTEGGRDTAPLADISALAGMPLNTVIIEGTAVENLQPLKGLPIRTLHVPRTNVRDISQLKGMMLASVNFSGTRVYDFSALSPMPVKSFTANNSQLRDMGFMKSWQLESVDISDTRVFDLSVLSRMPLKRLIMANTQVRMLDFIKHCPIEELDISGSAVRELNPLSDIAATLQRLKIDRLPAKNYEVFRSLNLHALSLDDTDFSNLRLISHMPLVDLSLNNTPLNSLDGLDASQLSALKIEGTKVTSLQPLQNAGSLRRFYCRNTAIRNFTPIYDSGITHIVVDDPDSKTAVFKKLPNLESVNWVEWLGQ